MHAAASPYPLSRLPWLIRGGFAMWTAIVFTSGPLIAQTHSTASDSATAREGIERAWVQIIDQCKRGDWAGLTAGFTENGVYVNPEYRDAAGHEALKEMYDKLGGPNLRLVNLTRHVTHFIVNGDIALEGAESTEEWRELGKPGTEKGALRYLYVWKRQSDGRWRILYLMETTPSPAPKKGA
jgi:ketosteroid isomerase-like protein